MELTTRAAVEDTQYCGTHIAQRLAEIAVDTHVDGDGVDAAHICGDHTVMRAAVRDEVQNACRGRRISG